MGEVVNVLVAVAVIVLVVRWATSGAKDNSGTPSPSAILGFRPKNVTPEMVATLRDMFPDIPSDNIHFDLLKTGSVQQTSNKIIEGSFLPAPPPSYYRIYPRTAQEEPAQRGGAATTPGANAAAGPSKTHKSENLLTRYNLQSRATTTSVSVTPEAAGGMAKWEDTAEKREASLRERKAQMILAARERLLAQRATESEASSSP